MPDPRLHWSFAHGNSQPARSGVDRTLGDCFTSQLLDSARTWDMTGGGNGKSHYTILGNFWKGYKGTAGETRDGYDLRVGRATIERIPCQVGLDYAVEAVNTTSGEELRLAYRCEDSDYRELVGDWTVDAANRAGAGYASFSCTGSRSPDGSVSLHVQGQELQAGMAEPTVPLTCNWSLFDVVPLLADTIRSSPSQIRLDVLEDLEKVRNSCRIGFLEDWQLALESESVNLSGFYWFGVGAPPSYWWIIEDGGVGIVSTIHQTYVLDRGSQA